MSQNGNPLIGANKGDTIANTRDLVEWILIQADGDGITHPGMIAQLRLILDAVGSLKTEADGEKF
jgi:hypothetical protein